MLINVAFTQGDRVAPPAEDDHVIVEKQRFSICCNYLNAIKTTFPLAVTPHPQRYLQVSANIQSLRITVGRKFSQIIQQLSGHSSCGVWVSFI